MNEIKKRLDTWYHFKKYLAENKEDFDLADREISKLEAIIENQGPHPQLKLEFENVN